MLFMYLQELQEKGQEALQQVISDITQRQENLKATQMNGDLLVVALVQTWIRIPILEMDQIQPLHFQLDQMTKKT